MDDIKEVLNYIENRIADVCLRPLLNQPNDAFAHGAIRAKVLQVIQEASSDVFLSRIDFDVRGEGDMVHIDPKNLYTAVALQFPQYLIDVGVLPDEGSIQLSNGVIVCYSHSAGASVTLPEPADYVDINFTIRGGSKG